MIRIALPTEFFPSAHRWPGVGRSAGQALPWEHRSRKVANPWEWVVCAPLGWSACILLANAPKPGPTKRAGSAFCGRAGLLSRFGPEVYDSDTLELMCSLGMHRGGVIPLGVRHAERGGQRWEHVRCANHALLNCQVC